MGDSIILQLVYEVMFTSTIYHIILVGLADKFESLVMEAMGTYAPVLLIEELEDVVHWTSFHKSADDGALSLSALEESLREIRTIFRTRVVVRHEKKCLCKRARLLALLIHTLPIHIQAKELLAACKAKVKVLEAEYAVFKKEERERELELLYRRR